MGDSDIKIDFAARMQEICDDMDLPRERGRQAALAKHFRVTPNAARKWLLGIGMPELDVAIEIAKWAEVNSEWLLSGRGPKRGNLIDTKSLVLDEALRSMGPEYRRQTLDHIRYMLERARARFKPEKIEQYSEALDRYEAETQRGKRGH